MTLPPRVARGLGDVAVTPHELATQAAMELYQKIIEKYPQTPVADLAQEGIDAIESAAKKKAKKKRKAKRAKPANQDAESGGEQE